MRYLSSVMPKSALCEDFLLPLFVNEKNGIEIRELLSPVPSGEEGGISVYIYM